MALQEDAPARMLKTRVPEDQIYLEKKQILLRWLPNEMNSPQHLFCNKCIYVYTVPGNSAGDLFGMVK